MATVVLCVIYPDDRSDVEKTKTKLVLLSNNEHVGFQVTTTIYSLLF